MTIKIEVSPLTADGFAPYGEVVELEGAERIEINQGTTERFHDLANIDAGKDGTPIVSIFKSQPRALPIKLEVIERHPLGSQLFFPLQNRDWLVVVAKGENPLSGNSLKAFRATGRQGVNYGMGIWHHPLLVLDADSLFMVIDRKGPGNNVEEKYFNSLPQDVRHFSLLL